MGTALSVWRFVAVKLEVTLLPPNLRKSGSQLPFDVKPQTAFHLSAQSHNRLE
jgi:hypothetical protein